MTTTIGDYRCHYYEYDYYYYYYYCCCSYLLSSCNPLGAVRALALATGLRSYARLQGVIGYFVCSPMDGSSAALREHELNRQSWNAATEQHRTHKPGLVSNYVDKGRNNLFTEDVELLGNLVEKDVLHLQCNDGQDTVSIARWLKPRQVHGVDISDSAIKFAEELRGRMLTENCFPAGTDVRFTRRDVVEYLNDPANSSSADVVYSSYGTVNWLSNLTTWADGIAKVLRPGGRFVIIDFHTIAVSLDWQSMKLTDDCLGGVECPSESGVSDYVGQDATFQNPNPAMEYAWGVGDIVTSLLATKQMQLQSLTEYPYINGWMIHPDLSAYPLTTSEAHQDVADSTALTPGYEGLPQNARYSSPAGCPRLPMMYSIVCEKHRRSD